MKKFLSISFVSLALFITGKVYSQGFVAVLEGEGLSALYGNSCIIKLESGGEIHGKFVGGTYSANGLNKISVKLENGEKAKFIPEQVISLQIKASTLLKLSMVSESNGSVAQMVHTDFNGIVNRDYIIFETALTAKKSKLTDSCSY